MKKTINTLAILLVSVIFILPFQGCGKYEDGPSISLKTKKGRLSQSWTVEKYVAANGTETAASGNEGSSIFNKDGSYSWSDGSVSINGTWSFDDPKENLSVTITIFGISSTSTSKILRLTSSELWTADSNGDETHMKSE